MIQIAIAEQAFDPLAKLSAFQSQAQFEAKSSGANAIFIGTMRDFNEGDTVQAMYLDHYPAMTHKQLTHLATAMTTKFHLNHVLIVHRVGNILPSDPIVLVATWSTHRKAAFQACQQLMEDLKHQAPFWKRETLSNGAHRWVTRNTTG